MLGRLGSTALAGLALAAAATAAAASPSGTWRRLPPAPVAPTSAVAVWTGSRLLLFGRAQPHPPWSVDVAAAYDPAVRAWRRLTPLPGDRGNYEGRYTALWTGAEALVFGPFDGQAYSPRTNRWRRLPRTLPAEFAVGLVVWTGRRAIAWGGGCCGDASSAGAAFDPRTGAVRALPRSPLAPSQSPVGAWTGRELVVLVDGVDPDGKPYRASLARAAAYDPATRTWRRIAPPPAAPLGPAVWDGRELLLAGAGVAYDPAADRWRRLAPMPSGRTQFAAVWTGRRLLVWGGRGGSGGLAYDPAANRWSRLPPAPLAGRPGPLAVWTGRALVVLGGGRSFADGAAFAAAP